MLPEQCFCSETNRENLNVLRFIHVLKLVLKRCSSLTERNWKQVLFYFCVLVIIAVWVFLLIVFIYGSCFRLKFSRVAPLQKQLQLNSRTDLTTNGLLLEFLLRRCLAASFFYLQGFFILAWWALPMNSNFTSYVCASCSLFSRKISQENFLLTSQKHFVRFPGFLVILTVFWCFTPFTH